MLKVMFFFTAHTVMLCFHVILFKFSHFSQCCWLCIESTFLPEAQKSCSFCLYLPYSLCYLLTLAPSGLLSPNTNEDMDMSVGVLHGSFFVSLLVVLVNIDAVVK